MHCSFCGCPNLPFSEQCGHCRLRLSDAAQAGQARKQWELLPEEKRRQFEHDIVDRRAQFLEYLHYRRWSMIRHAGLGSLLMGWAFIFAQWLILRETSLDRAIVMAIPDFVIGAAAGFFLTRADGGEGRGLLIFAAAFFMSFASRFFLGLDASILLSVISGHVFIVEGGGFLLGMFIRHRRESWKNREYELWMDDEPNQNP